MSRLQPGDVVQGIESVYDIGKEIGDGGQGDVSTSFSEHTYIFQVSTNYCKQYLNFNAL